MFCQRNSTSVLFFALKHSRLSRSFAKREHKNSKMKQMSDFYFLILHTEIVLWCSMAQRVVPNQCKRYYFCHKYRLVYVCYLQNYFWFQEPSMSYITRFSETCWTLRDKICWNHEIKNLFSKDYKLKYFALKVWYTVCRARSLGSCMQITQSYSLTSRKMHRKVTGAKIRWSK